MSTAESHQRSIIKTQLGQQGGQLLVSGNWSETGYSGVLPRPRSPTIISIFLGAILRPRVLKL
jgi:hypothetical protein